MNEGLRSFLRWHRIEPKNAALQKARESFARTGLAALQLKKKNWALFEFGHSVGPEDPMEVDPTPRWLTESLRLVS